MPAYIFQNAGRGKINFLIVTHLNDGGAIQVNQHIFGTIMDRTVYLMIYTSTAILIRLKNIRLCFVEYL